ncbi:hypothetical protein LTR17_022827 [Elasticomyces elasticus]|nr:hypothetical protein LTR17_022827 [Elasticomyces elasticus]
MPNGEDVNILSDFERDDGKAAGLAGFDGRAAGNTDTEDAIVNVLGRKGVLRSDTAAGEVVGDEESDAERDLQDDNEELDSITDRAAHYHRTTLPCPSL